MRRRRVGRALRRPSVTATRWSRGGWWYVVDRDRSVGADGGRRRNGDTCVARRKKKTPSIEKSNENEKILEKKIKFLYQFSILL